MGKLRQIAAQHNVVVPESHNLLASESSAQVRAGPQEQVLVKCEVEATDRAIDALVYELHGLTPDEIKIVEGRE